MDDIVNYPFSEVDLRLGRWDARRTYKIFDYVQVGEKFIQLSQDYQVCLATQSSVDRMHSIVELSDQWAGPISLSLFVSGSDELRILQIFVNHLRACHPNLRDRVTMHLAIPGDRTPADGRPPLQDPVELFEDCSIKPDEYLKRIMKTLNPETEKWRIKNPYPQNHMRNIARKGCQNGYVFMTDVDIVPSNGFAESLNEFLKRPNCTGQCAYVVPTYELDIRVEFPKNKADLLRLAAKGLARPFHHKIFIYNQFATNFTKWQAAKVESNKTHVSHVVTNFEFLYEPFYIAPDTVPLHDERFVGYGYTRNTQVYETYVAGYQFVVLSPIFTCHWGMTNRRTRPAWRERQNYLNRRHFEVFKREVFARYHKDPLKMMQPKRPQQQQPVIKVL
ncbi:beta-1,4-glucuronyltransferase 1-like [Ctenocephalides felis]|uniref:beta-1,4-glucuronyltransferase 1-like n=1 Tax=Ctenocephalides felis TaxID=7515 RepID=UPI000E6E3F01|nr:beta-1,4-glucuronyltransferase 1-like [Ctenocephalides felis]